MNSQQTPRVGRWLLRVARLGSRRDEVEADLLELFATRSTQRGRFYACRRYFADVVSLCCHGVLPARPLAGLRAAKQDVVFAARLFLRHPALFGVTVAGLSVAIAISAAVFSIVKGVAFADYGIKEPHSVFRVALTSGVFTRVTGDSPHSGNWAFSDYSTLQHTVPSLDLVASVRTQAEYRQSRDSSVEPVTIMAISDRYFSVLGLGASHGRTLTSVDAAPGIANVVVSQGFWKNRLDANPSIVGHTVWLNDIPYMIVGVAARAHSDPGNYGRPPAFWTTFTANAQAWTSQFTANRNETRSRLEAAKHLHRSAEVLEARLNELDADLTAPPPDWNPAVDVLGRLQPDTTRAQAEAQVKAAAVALARERGRTAPNQQPTVRLATLDEAKNDSLVIVSTLLTAVGFVIFLACANVANLLLANAATRRREIGTRLAIGASQGRIVRQLLTESVLLGLLSGALGLAVVWLMMPAIAVLVRVPPASDVSPDLRACAFVGFLAITAGLMAGLAPARYGRRGDLLSALKTDQMAAPSATGRSALRSVLIGGQSALSVVLLVVAALLTRALVKNAELDPGYDASRMLNVSIGYGAGLRSWTTDRTQALWSGVLERVREIPGVAGAALTTTPPFGNGFAVQVVNGRQIDRNETSPDFFNTLGVPLIRGRVYTADEVLTQAPVAVISASLAAAFWGAEDPLGDRLERVWGADDRDSDRLGGLLRKPPGTRVIGVVGDTTTRLRAHRAPTVYLPLAPTSVRRLVVKAQSDPAALEEPVRQALEALDPTVRVSATLAAEGMRRELETPKILVSLAVGVGSIALGLALIGLFGVTAFVVEHRVHEMSVRRALGATEGQLLRLLLQDSLRPVLIGLSVGLFASLLAGRIIQAMLYGVSSRDPVAILLAAGVLTGAAAVAVWMPARRAAAVDPAQLLKLG